MKAWYLIDEIGGYDLYIEKLPKQYQNKKSAIKYGKATFNALSIHDKNRRTEFYVSYCSWNEETGLNDQIRIYNCMKGE